MKRRTIVGIIFIVAALLKLFHMWGIFNLDWLWWQPWTEYFGPLVLLYIGTELIIYSFNHYFFISIHIIQRFLIIT